MTTSPTLYRILMSSEPGGGGSDAAGTGKEFFQMNEFPEKEDNETFSKTVLVFEEGDNSFCDFGYYDYKANEWNVLGGMSMKLICWCYPPNPAEFLKDKSYTHATHYGYC